MGELLGYSFFLNALCGVLIIAVAAAMVGTYIVARRLVAISGASPMPVSGVSDLAIIWV